MPIKPFYKQIYREIIHKSIYVLNSYIYSVFVSFTPYRKRNEYVLNLNLSNYKKEYVSKLVELLSKRYDAVSAKKCFDHIELILSEELKGKMTEESLKIPAYYFNNRNIK